MALTTDQIHAAADQIAADGQNPTLAAVRAAVGGGSYTTISEALKGWRAARAAAPADAAQEPPPSAVTQAAETFAAAVWSAAQELAQGRLEVEREALAAARQEMEQSRAEVAELADQLSGEVESLRSELERRQANEAQTAAALAIAKEGITTIRAEAAELRIRLEERTGERDRLLADRERLERERVELERALAAAQAKA